MQDLDGPFARYLSNRPEDAPGNCRRRRSRRRSFCPIFRILHGLQYSLLQRADLHRNRHRPPWPRRLPSGRSHLRWRRLHRTVPQRFRFRMRSAPRTLPLRRQRQQEPGRWRHIYWKYSRLCRRRAGPLSSRRIHLRQGRNPLRPPVLRLRNLWTESRGRSRSSR